MKNQDISKIVDALARHLGPVLAEQQARELELMVHNAAMKIVTEMTDTILHRVIREMIDDRLTVDLNIRAIHQQPKVERP